VLVSPYLQDPDSGEFVFTHLGDVDYITLSIVSAVGILMSVALFVISAVRKKQNLKEVA
jgi:hypothetical protein